MKKIVRNRWLMFLIIIIVFVLLDLQIQNVSLAQRGIVLGIGIDKEGDDYVITAEFIAPSNGGVQNYQKNTLLCQEKGKSIDEAFEKMDKTLGSRVSLKHTVLIVMGNSVLESGDYAPLIDLLVGNEVFDSTNVIGVKGKAEDLFNARPPMYTTVSYRIAETLRNPDIESGVVIVNVKDFFRMYASKSEAIYLPIVEIIKGGSSESDSDGGKRETDSLELGQIAILTRTGKKLTLSGEGSAGLSYIYSEVNEGNIYIGNSGDGSGFDVNVIDTLTTKKFDADNMTLTLDVRMWVKPGNRTSNDIEDYLDYFTDKERKMVEDDVRNKIETAYKTCHEENVDILGIANGFYRILGKRYKEVIGENYLDRINIVTDVNIIAK